MESHQKGFLKLKCFFLLSKYWLPLLFEETLRAFLFPSLFLYAPSLEDSGVLMLFEEKIMSSKTSFQMA
jgi:hypothetical protein